MPVIFKDSSQEDRLPNAQKSSDKIVSGGAVSDADAEDKVSKKEDVASTAGGGGGGDDDDDDVWAIFTRGLVSYDDSSDSVSIESEKPFGYYLEIQALLSTFNVALEELSLLKRIVNTPIANVWDETVTYRTAEERFGGSKHLVFEESEFDNLNDRQKVLKDICFVFNILRDGYISLENNDSYECTIEAIQDMFRLQEDNELIFLEHDENLRRIGMLKRQLKTEKRQFLKKLTEMMHEIFLCKNEYEDKLVYGRYNVKYVDGWEKSRNEQNRLRNKLLEDDFRKIINDSNFKLGFETRVHSDIKMWLETNTEDMTEEISYWQNHYEEERDRWDLEIYNLKTARDQVIEVLEEKKIIFNQHQVVIDDWNAWREEQRRLQEEHEERVEALIKLQAWWRGILVRKQWGPYRPRKGKKGKKGKEKGGLPKLPGRK